MEKNSDLIYIGSPYTHPEKEVRHRNYIEVTKIAAEIVSNGQVAISPITYGHVLLDYAKMPSDWEFWSDFCLTLLKKCDKILVCNNMEGWDRSRGLTQEIQYAKDNDIEIEYILPIDK
jgi:hypothetical protein